MSGSGKGPEGGARVLKLVRRRKTKPRPVATVVETLAEWLKRAKAGQVQGIAIAATMDDEGASTHIDTGDGAMLTLLAATTMLQQRMALRVLEESTKEGPSPPQTTRKKNNKAAQESEGKQDSGDVGTPTTKGEG